MRCPGCHAELERPGDRCLACGATPTDAVVLSIENDRARLTMMAEEDELGTTAITTRPEADDPSREVQRRNYIGRIADEVRRKQPEAVYVQGTRELVGRLRRSITVDLYRLDGPNPVAAYRDRRGDTELTVVEAAPAEKIGGRHSTLIGERSGQRAVHTVAEHPHVKKVVPGPIDGSGGGSHGGVRAKVTRAGRDGNIRLLLREGSSVQEIRLVTTASTRRDGERIAEQLNEALADVELRG